MTLVEDMMRAAVVTIVDGADHNQLFAVKFSQLVG